MSEELTISKIGGLPADLDGLVEASLAEGFGFLERLREEWVSGANRFAAPGEVLFEARHRGRLAGVCGLNRDPYLDQATAGRIRRLYVAPEARRLGIARRLVREVVREAQDHFAVLRLRTDTPTGDLFYRALGFEPVTQTDSATHELRLPMGEGRA
jgi:GNAT superfamily N-acetyltransferase